MTTLGLPLGHNLHTLLRASALPVIAFIVFFEAFDLPGRLPGELKMLLAGVQAAQDIYPLWLVLIVQEVAALLGGSALYAMLRSIGHPLVVRSGRYLHLRESTLDRRACGAVVVAAR